MLCHDIEDFITRIKSYGLLVKLDTNGSFPQKLEALLNKGLIDYVAMDIKNSKDKYAITAGVDSFPENIEKSIDIIMSKAPDYEFRTTVVRELHTTQDIVNIPKRIYNPKKYYSGRSPLEALSIGVDLRDTDIAIRTNIVTISDDNKPFGKIFKLCLFAFKVYLRSAD